MGINKQGENGEWIDEYNPTGQSANENLTDMIAGFFSTDGLGYEQAVTIYNNALEIAGSSFEYNAIAQSVAKELNDNLWARALFTKALDLAETEEDYSIIAGTVALSLQDKRWARALFIEALEYAENSIDYGSIASSVIEYLKDISWGEELYNRAYCLSKTSEDLCFLASMIHYNLKDKKWSECLLIEAQKSAQTSLEYSELSREYSRILNDKSEGAKLLKSALKLAADFEDYYKIAEIYIDEPEEVKEYKNVLNQAIPLSKNTNDLCRLIYLLSLLYQDKLKVALWESYNYDPQITAYSISYSIFNNYENSFGETIVRSAIDFYDKTWAAELFSKAENSIPFIDDDDVYYRALARNLYTYFREYWEEIKESSLAQFEKR